MKAWSITAPNPNLRITGAAQVPRHHGRDAIRDGYHRSYGLLARGELLARGITHAHAFVRDFGVGPLGTSPGLFSTEVYLSERPPVLNDFRDDEVAADVDVPAVQKMIVIQGMELSPLG